MRPKTTRVSRGGLTLLYTGGDGSVFLFHVVEDVLHVFVFLEFLKQFLYGFALFGSHLLIVGRDALELRADETISKPFSSRYFWMAANWSNAP